jgi:hypothetical protein
MVIELVVLPWAFTVPFSVAELVVTLVAACVVTSGATGLGAFVVNDSVAPLAVPPAFVAEARK